VDIEDEEGRDNGFRSFDDYEYVDARYIPHIVSCSECTPVISVLLPQIWMNLLSCRRLLQRLKKADTVAWPDIIKLTINSVRWGDNMQAANASDLLLYTLYSLAHKLMPPFPLPLASPSSSTVTTLDDDGPPPASLTNIPLSGKTNIIRRSLGVALDQPYPSATKRGSPWITFGDQQSLVMSELFTVTQRLELRLRQLETLTCRTIKKQSITSLWSAPTNSNRPKLGTAGGSLSTATVAARGGGTRTTTMSAAAKAAAKRLVATSSSSATSSPLLSSSGGRLLAKPANRAAIPSRTNRIVMTHDGDTKRRSATNINDDDDNDDDDDTNTTDDGDDNDNPPRDTVADTSDSKVAEAAEMTSKIVPPTSSTSQLKYINSDGSVVTATDLTALRAARMIQLRDKSLSLRRQAIAKGNDAFTRWQCNDIIAAIIQNTIRVFEWTNDADEELNRLQSDLEMRSDE
jgi:hypothetical protein